MGSHEQTHWQHDLTDQTRQSEGTHHPPNHSLRPDKITSYLPLTDSSSHSSGMLNQQEIFQRLGAMSLPSYRPESAQLLDPPVVLSQLLDPPVVLSQLLDPPVVTPQTLGTRDEITDIIVHLGQNLQIEQDSNIDLAEVQGSEIATRNSANYKYSFKEDFVPLISDIEKLFKKEVSLSNLPDTIKKVFDEFINRKIKDTELLACLNYTRSKKCILRIYKKLLCEGNESDMQDIPIQTVDHSIDNLIMLTNAIADTYKKKQSMSSAKEQVHNYFQENKLTDRDLVRCLRFIKEYNGAAGSARRLLSDYWGG